MCIAAAQSYIKGRRKIVKAFVAAYILFVARIVHHLGPHHRLTILSLHSPSSSAPPSTCSRSASSMPFSLPSFAEPLVAPALRTSPQGKTEACDRAAVASVSNEMLELSVQRWPFAPPVSPRPAASPSSPAPSPPEEYAGMCLKLLGRGGTV